MAILLLRRKRWAAVVLLALGLAAITFACLPGRSIDSTRLRETYVRSLTQYMGSPYVWGGESRFGMDCSGLVRRGLIDANVRLAAVTLNPAYLRAALRLWWHDCSALALRDGYRGFTAPVLTAESIDAIPDASILPGDIAVTSNGVHVLAYLGQSEWIEADPGVMEVIRVKTPSENVWFHVPIHVLRWTEME
jgi:cell wall-associated NlpC family hydrolase